MYMMLKKLADAVIEKHHRPGVVSVLLHLNEFTDELGLPKLSWDERFELKKSLESRDEVTKVYIPCADLQYLEIFFNLDKERV